MIRLLYLFLAITVLSGCATRGMRVLTTRAANIVVPSHIKKVVLINRSKADGSAAVEGFFSGELPGSDLALSQECLRGLNQTLNRSTRFQTTINERILQSGNASSMQFGTYLDWATVEAICDSAGADALLAVEFFDSDFTITPPVPRVGSNPITFETTANANARAGFRLYDRVKKSVVYENYFRHSRRWSATGANIIETASRLLRRNDALRQISYSLGEDFAAQLVPLNYWEDRRMFRGKDDATKRAERLGLTDNWREAATVWESAFMSSDKAKIRAAAAYNLALSYEILGDLDLAKKWVSESYVTNGNRHALRYSEIIDNLIINKRRLEEQLKQIDEINGN